MARVATSDDIDALYQLVKAIGAACVTMLVVGSAIATIIGVKHQIRQAKRQEDEAKAKKATADRLNEIKAAVEDNEVVLTIKDTLAAHSDWQETHEQKDQERALEQTKATATLARGLRLMRKDVVRELKAISTNGNGANGQH